MFHVVSIHAPTRGATPSTPRRPTRLRVSIHAPTRGATNRHRADSPHGAVSIHAPTRGATRSLWLYRSFGRVSIHAPTRGATQFDQTLKLWNMFQSTRPHGARLIFASLNKKLMICFNPRAHTGRDQYDGDTTDVPDVSIHAPTRGATK